jgi:hypothetical protein
LNVNPTVDFDVLGAAIRSTPNSNRLGGLRW